MVGRSKTKSVSYYGPAIGLLYVATLIAIILAIVLSYKESSSNTIPVTNENSSSTGLPDFTSSSTGVPDFSSSIPYTGPTTLYKVQIIQGQSNARGTNSLNSGFENYPINSRIQEFCGIASGCVLGTYRSAQFKAFNDYNVGISLAYANALLPTLAPNEGIILLNTAQGGQGFESGCWGPSNSYSCTQTTTVAAANLWSTFSSNFPGAQLVLDSMLWQGGENDAGDNGSNYFATKSQYAAKIAGLIDFQRANLPNASATTPWTVGGMLPYWVDLIPGSAGVASALADIHSIRPYTAYANTDNIPINDPGGLPNGDRNMLSGGPGHPVIHFDEADSQLMGVRHFNAYQVARAG